MWPSWKRSGWCERMPTIRGDGMLVWLTPSGLNGVGLRGLPPLRTPEPFLASHPAEHPGRLGGR